jgi:hypothetical protein
MGKLIRRARKAYVVFVSHSTCDAWIARTIGEKIDALGASSWLDMKDLERGEVLVDSIINGIDGSDEAVVVISPKSINSQWIMFEIGAARIQRKRVTPILNNVGYDAIKPLKDVKAVDLNEIDDFLFQLKKRIEKVDFTGT